MSGILLQSVHCLSPPPIYPARSGVLLPCSILNCSSLGRCSPLRRSQSLFRTLRVSNSKSFLAFVVDSIAHLGFVGVILGSSNVGLNAIPEWQFPPVSPQFRRLVRRSALQVRFLPLFSSSVKVNRRYGPYLMVLRLKPTLTQIRRIMDSLLSFAFCVTLDLQLEGLSALFVHYAHFLDGHCVGTIEAGSGQMGFSCLVMILLIRCFCTLMCGSSGFIQWLIPRGIDS